MSYKGRIADQAKKIDQVNDVIKLLNYNLDQWYHCRRCSYQSKHWITAAQHIIKEHPEVLDNESTD